MHERIFSFWCFLAETASTEHARFDSNRLCLYLSTWNKILFSSKGARVILNPMLFGNSHPSLFQQISRSVAVSLCPQVTIEYTREPWNASDTTSFSFINTTWCRRQLKPEWQRLANPTRLFIGEISLYPRLTQLEPLSPIFHSIPTSPSRPTQPDY